MEDCEGRTLRAICKKCEKNPKRRKPISAYTSSLLRVHYLQEAGFQFQNDSLDLQFWMDLSLLKSIVAPRVL